jgi:hypothetical protein
VKRLVAAAVLGLVSLVLAPQVAHADGTPTASFAIPSVRYNGSGCLELPVTLNVSGGVSNGFAYWTTENETLVGPTSLPTPPGFFLENEQTPGTESMTMCPWADHPGVYTYSADVWFKNWSDQGGEQYAGRVSTTFTLGLAASTVVKVGRHTWQLQIVGQPYLVSSPTIYLQKLKAGKWRTISHGIGNSAGKVSLKKRSAGKYRLMYKGDVDRGVGGSTSKAFKRP